jgi:tetratricopeptide (TPR) repeat protein
MAASNSTPTAPAQKLCIACKEPIPADATLCFHCQTRQIPQKEPGTKRLLAWIGVVTAVIGLITGLSGIAGPLKGWWKQGRQSHTLLATAQRQEELGEYSAAMDTLAEILKATPSDTQALHTQLDVAMLWIEEIRTPRHNVDDVAPQARTIFDRLTPILEGGLSTAKGYRAADVVAHLGWLNFLRENITGQGGITESHLREALRIDPENVYANAMIGEWLLLPPANLEEAKTHFATALKSGKAKSFVRGCQLEGMIYNEEPGVRAELIRVANQMRKDNDPISSDDKGRIHSYFSTTIGTDAELREVVSAASPDEVWATYEWVSPPAAEASDFNKMEARFIQANIDELSGKREDALQIYRSLDQELKQRKDSGPRISQRVRDAVQRLIH